jgi:hypothetical protein
MNFSKVTVCHVTQELTLLMKVLVSHVHSTPFLLQDRAPVHHVVLAMNLELWILQRVSLVLQDSMLPKTRSV